MSLGGYGQWKTEGCTVVEETEDVMTFQCNHLTNFAVLQVCAHNTKIQHIKMY